MLKHKAIISGALMVLLSGCGAGQSDQSGTALASTPLVAGIDIAEFDSSVRPGDNFFRYVNGKWIDRHEIPADKSSYGTFQILRDEAQVNVRKIIESAAEGDFQRDSDEQRVGGLYRAYLDKDARNALGVRPLAPEFAAIDAIKNTAQLTRYFAAASRRGYDSPIGLFQMPDPKDPAVYVMALYQSGLGLPDREYYLKDDEASQRIRDEYVAHIAAMFELAGMPDAASQAEDILKLETDLAREHMRKEDLRDWSANYNKITSEDFPALMAQVDWAGFWAETGFEAQPPYVIALTVDYLNALDKQLAESALNRWQVYLKWVVLNNAASRLSEAFDAQNFAFYGGVLSGTEAQEEPWKRAVNSVNRSLGEIVGKVYVREHFPPAAKVRMVELVDKLKLAYRQSIESLDWMSDETKIQALDKLSKFRAKIGYPDEWIDYSGIEISANDLFGNLARITEFDHQRYLARHDGPVDRDEWGMTPQTVNAYYRSSLNEIVFPAAILQPPFFNMSADDAVNYGGIGAVIGHEIGHGFDDSGSQFDGDGVLRNWWTDQDRAEFETRTSALVAQYNSFQPFDDLHVNGEYTLGENIGDLGGIGIALRAYELSLMGQPALVIDDLTGVQRVFLGFAQVWRGQYREQALRRLIATNPHAPSEYRANGSVRNVDAFYQAFDVQPTDALYLAPDERVKIW